MYVFLYFLVITYCYKTYQLFLLLYLLSSYSTEIFENFSCLIYCILTTVSLPPFLPVPPPTSSLNQISFSFPFRIGQASQGYKPIQEMIYKKHGASLHIKATQQEEKDNKSRQKCQRQSPLIEQFLKNTKLHNNNICRGHRGDQYIYAP